MVDFVSLQEEINKQVDLGIIPTLMDFIRVSSLSPSFDANWETNGLMEQAQ